MTATSVYLRFIHPRPPPRTYRTPYLARPPGTVLGAPSSRAFSSGPGGRIGREPTTSPPRWQCSTRGAPGGEGRPRPAARRPPDSTPAAPPGA